MAQYLSGRQPSNMMHQFSQVPKVEIPRSSFNRSHGYKTTFNAGYLVPVFSDEVLPGDTFNLNMTTFARLATPIHPIMDNMQMDAFFFFVPYRLIWTHFVNFFGEQANPTDTTSYLVPTMTSPVGGYVNGSIHDYLGLPTQVAGIVNSVFYHRAYNLIWNQWFRDENLQNSVPQNMGDGPDAVTDYVLLRRGKRHDYFTSSLPFPQKGPAVTIPIATSAPIKTQATEVFTGAGTAMLFRSTSGSLATASVQLGTGPTGGLGLNASAFSATVGLYPSNLYADLSASTAGTINQLRQAFQIQRMYERDARGGTRYTELIQSHFGVTSPDARLQRAEF